MTAPVTVTLPPELAKLEGFVDGLTDRGELIVSQTHKENLGGGILTVLDPATGATQPVVDRPPARSQAEAASQVAGATGNADWIVWEETGFTLEVGDWSMWALERATGTIHRIASFEPGANGQALPGWPSNVAISGDLAAWSASIQVRDTIEPRIYVADLRKGTARRLDVDGKWPSFISPDRLSSVVLAGTDENGKALAVPATIAVADGTVTKQDWMDPVRVLAYAASGSGAVAIRFVKAATAEDSVTVLDAITRDAHGIVRMFTLPNDSSEVAAGTGYLAWTDDQHLWILPSGRVDPQELASVGVDDGVGIQASASSLYWASGGVPGLPTMRSTVSISCP